MKSVPVAIAKADLAIRLIDEFLLDLLQDDPVRELIADIVRHQHNVPFMVTVYEAVQEVKPPYKNGHIRQE